MKKPLFFFLCCMLLVFTSVKGKSINVTGNDINDNVVFSGMKKPVVTSPFASPDSLKNTVKDTVHHKKHRLVAALLAFPLGVFGLHRMYLGTGNNIPFIYIVTVGGGFGVLPFIDFVLILLSKDIHKTYTNNHHLFMWQKK